MAVGAKYAPLTRWLKDCGQAEIQLTFSEMDQIVTLPPSAYTNRTLWGNSGQSFSSGWMGAGYLVGRVDMKAQWVRFRRGPDPRGIREGKERGGEEHRVPEETAAELLACGRRVWSAVERDPHHRYRSWEHCYHFFQEHRTAGKEEILDQMCLQLAWYLASWGMLRNSFLFQKDYLFHRPAVEFLLEPRWAGLWGLSGEHLACSEGAEQVMTLCGGLTALYERYGGGTPTDTLLTKILLGTLGCVPAYDRYLKEALRRTGAAPGVLGVRSLTQLGQFYLDRRMDFEELHRLCAAGGVEYPPSKLLDMCFFQYGWEHDARRRREEPVG